MDRYERPARVADALHLLSNGPLQVLAGGTDVYPALRDRPLSGGVLDLTGARELRGIRARRDHWRIGATTTWSEILAARLPPLFDGLKRAAREIGGEQIQNAGTVAGNLCNASPAADGVPALLALGAEVELRSKAGTRRMALGDFLLGPRRTALRRDELMTAVRVPRPRAAAASHFLKLGARRYLVISIAMASAVLEHERGQVQAARVSVGACSGVAVRLGALETALQGQRFARSLADHVRAAHFAGLTPIADVRASAAYRREAAQELVRRLLREMV